MDSKEPGRVDYYRRHPHEVDEREPGGLWICGACGLAVADPIHVLATSSLGSTGPEDCPRLPDPAPPSDKMPRGAWRCPACKRIQRGRACRACRVARV